MDLRINIIQSIMSTLKDRVDENVLNMIQDVVTLELNNYDIQEKCTKVAVVDNTPEKL